MQSLCSTYGTCALFLLRYGKYLKEPNGYTALINEKKLQNLGLLSEII